jgi:hypothetical protein
MLRNRKVTIAALAGILLLSAAANANANLVTNGGFETGDLTGWTVSNANSATSPTDIAIYPWFTWQPSFDPLYIHSGNHAVGLGSAYPGNGSDATISQNISTVSGQNYNVSFWFNATYGTTCYSGYCNYTDFNVSFGGQSLLSLTNLPPSPNHTQTPYGWQYYSFDVAATGPSSLLLFGDQFNLGHFALDDISVTGLASPPAVPLPAALPLFATGLGALGLLGWRRKRKKDAAASTAA